MTEQIGPGEAELPRSNFFQRILGALFSPVETFREIASRPDVLFALVIIILIGVTTNVIVAPHLDLESSLREQFDKQGMTESQIDRALNIAETMQRFTAPLAAVFIPLTLLVITGVSLIAVKLFGGDGSFRQFFAVTTYAWLPHAIRYILFASLVAFKGSLTVEEMAVVLKSNPAFLVSMSDSPALFSLLSQIDVFTIWTVALLILGYTAASRMARATVASIVIGLWLVLVLGKVGIALLQTIGGGS